MSEIAQSLYRQWTLLVPLIHFVGNMFYPPHLAQILHKISSMLVRMTLLFYPLETGARDVEKSFCRGLSPFIEKQT